MKKQKTQHPKGTAYLVHLDRPLYGSTGHYLGFAEEGNLDTRLTQHGTTSGAKMLLAARQRGINFECVRTWENVTRKTERSLKNRKDARSLCPHCKDDRREAKKFYDAMRKLRVKRISWN